VPVTTQTIADLEVTLHTGERTRLSHLAADGPLVVFFYPKAFTGGCTAQACHFRDLASEFAEVGASRVGVSRDDVETQARFADEHRFDYPLLADPDGEVAKAFGAKRPGPLWSKRQTYVVDADLTLLGAISSETDMEKHADEALELLRARQG
jgi:thioredoxin-dependent peroxiredoxin